MFYETCVLKNFAKFTRKQLCQSFFFNKVAGLSLINSGRGAFEFCEIFKDDLFYRIPPVAASTAC